MSNWKLKKIGKHIFIHYFITFLGEHANVDNVINALLISYAIVLASMYMYSWLITFEIFLNFFWIEGGLVWVYHIQTFLDFYIFLYLQGPSDKQVANALQLQNDRSSSKYVVVSGHLINFNVGGYRKEFSLSQCQPISLIPIMFPGSCWNICSSFENISQMS